MKNSTLFSTLARQNNSFYCCCESLKRNAKFILVFILFMGAFTQGVSAQGSLVPSCNIIGPLEACAVANPLDISGDIVITVQVARSGAGVSLNYSFSSNSSGAFIRSMDPITWTGYPGTNISSQTLHVFPGTNVSEFNLLLNVVNNQSSPATVCSCSKSVSISKVAATSSFSPILCYGQTSTLTAVGSFSDVGTYTYTLLPTGPTNTTGVFPGLPGSVAGITYVVNVESAEGCVTTTSQTITQPAFNPVVLHCPIATTTNACLSQNAINSAFNTWLASFNYTGGTAPIQITRNPSQPNAPSACGGSVTVTWSATEGCAADPVACSSTFTVPSPPAVVLTAPQNKTTAACLTQAAIDSD